MKCRVILAMPKVNKSTSSDSHRVELSSKELLTLHKLVLDKLKEYPAIRSGILNNHKLLTSQDERALELRTLLQKLTQSPLSNRLLSE